MLASIAKEDVGNGSMLFWLESLTLRATGDESGANAREGIAIDLGLRLADRTRNARRVSRAHEDLRQGRTEESLRGFEEALAKDPEQRYALFGRAGAALQSGDLETAVADLSAIVETWPDDVRAWNELAGVFSRQGDLSNARRAIDRALLANPFEIRALANAGLIAIALDERDAATSYLARIRKLSPLGISSQEQFLQEAIQ